MHVSRRSFQVLKSRTCETTTTVTTGWALLAFHREPLSSVHKLDSASTDCSTLIGISLPLPDAKQPPQPPPARSPSSASALPQTGPGAKPRAPQGSTSPSGARRPCRGRWAPAGLASPRPTGPAAAGGRPRPGPVPVPAAPRPAPRPAPRRHPRPGPARTVEAGAGDEPPPGRAAAQRLPAEQRPPQVQRHLLGPQRRRRPRLERAGHGVSGGRQVGREGPGAGGHGQHGGGCGAARSPPRPSRPAPRADVTAGPAPSRRHRASRPAPQAARGRAGLRLPGPGGRGVRGARQPCGIEILP